MSLVIMPLTMAQCSRSLLDSMKRDTKRSFLAMTEGSSKTLVSQLICTHIVFSCLAQMINLGTQVLISTYSKAPHYEPHNPHAHEPDTTKHHNCDEIRLICSICIKVIDLSLCITFYWIVQRSDHLRNVRNFTKQCKSRLASRTLHNSFWIWRFVGPQPMWWSTVRKAIKRWV